MAERELIVNLRLDNSKAKASNAEFAAHAKKTEAEILDDAKATEEGKVGFSRRGSRDRVAVAQGAAAGVKSAADSEGNALKNASEMGVNGFRKMALASAAFEVGLNKVLSLALKVGQAVTDAGEKSKALTKGFVEQRDSLGELATLMGRKADNDLTLDVAKFNAKTGFKPEEGKQFLTELYNSGAQYEGKNISKDEFKQYSEQTGALANARQIRPDVVGDVAGSVLGFTDYNKYGANASETGLGKVNSALATLGRGKGDNAVLARQFSMLSSSALNEDALKGTFTDSDEVAAVISVAAEKHDAQAAELAKIAGRAIRGFDKKKEGEQGALLKQAGVKPSDSFIESMTKINAVAQEEVAKRQATNPGFKVEDYLRENFKDEGAIDALNVFLNKGVSGGGFKDRMDFARENAGAGPAMDLINQYANSERGANRAVDAETKLEEEKKGAKNSELDLFRKRVLRNMIADGKVDTNSANIKQYLAGAMSFGTLGSGAQIDIDQAAQQEMIKRNGGKDDQTWGDYLNFSPTAREDDLRSRMARLRARGVNPLEDIYNSTGEKPASGPGSMPGALPPEAPKSYWASFMNLFSAGGEVPGEAATKPDGSSDSPQGLLKLLKDGNQLSAKQLETLQKLVADRSKDAPGPGAASPAAPVVPLGLPPKKQNSRGG